LPAFPQCFITQLPGKDWILYTPFAFDLLVGFDHFICSVDKDDLVHSSLNLPDICVLMSHFCMLRHRREQKKEPQLSFALFQ